MDVHPGEVIQTEYLAFNQSGEDLVGQAVPSVSPGTGAAYFNKIECFCFNQQPLKAKGGADLPLLFYLDETLPSDIQEVTLSYTIYDITDSVSPQVAKNNMGNGELNNENSI